MKVGLNGLSNFVNNLSPSQGQVGDKGSDFEKFLLDKIKQVDNEQKKAEEMIQALAEGKDVSLADVALSISKADLDFKLLLRIRNKVLDAYHEVMRMQI